MKGEHKGDGINKARAEPACKEIDDNDALHIIARK